MKADAGSSEGRDILSSRPLSGALFGLPIVAIVASGVFNIGMAWRTAVWAAALATMGVACLANALRCGRVHCYLTGPFFLALAIVAVLYGLGVMPLGASGWSVISLALLVGGVVLCCVPEALLGRYRQRRQ
jgi:hypothetical protein